MKAWCGSFVLLPLHLMLMSLPTARVDMLPCEYAKPTAQAPGLQTGQGYVTVTEPKQRQLLEGPQGVPIGVPLQPRCYILTLWPQPAVAYSGCQAPAWLLQLCCLAACCCLPALCCRQNLLCVSDRQPRLQHGERLQGSDVVLHSCMHAAVCSSAPGHSLGLLRCLEPHPQWSPPPPGFQWYLPSATASWRLSLLRQGNLPDEMLRRIR